MKNKKHTETLHWKDEGYDMSGEDEREKKSIRKKKHTEAGKTQKRKHPAAIKGEKRNTWMGCNGKKSPVGAKHPDRGLKNIFVHFHEKNFEKS